MLCDRYFSCLPLHKKANKVLQRWHVLAFYRITPCLSSVYKITISNKHHPPPAQKKREELQDKSPLTFCLTANHVSFILFLLFFALQGKLVNTQFSAK